MMEKMQLWCRSVPDMFITSSADNLNLCVFLQNLSKAIKMTTDQPLQKKFQRHNLTSAVEFGLYLHVKYNPVNFFYLKIKM